MLPCCWSHKGRSHNLIQLLTTGSKRYRLFQSLSHKLAQMRLPLYGNIEPDTNAQEPGQTTVFIYDPDTETVVSRDVTIAGVRENRLIVVDGLKAGDRVASAGVSFLREGQKVKLLADSK